MKIRCTLDGLVLHAEMDTKRPVLVAFDGEEPFVLDALEAIYYELVSASRDEVVFLERGHYRLLRRATDFRFLGN